MHEWNCKYQSMLCPQCKAPKSSELDQSFVTSILGAFRAMLLSTTPLSRTKILLKWDIVKTKDAYSGYLKKLECVMMNGPDNTLKYFERLLLPKESLSNPQFASQPSKNSQRPTGKPGNTAEGQQIVASHPSENSQRPTGKPGNTAEGQQVVASHPSENSQRPTGKPGNIANEVPMNAQARNFLNNCKSSENSQRPNSKFFGDKLTSCSSKKRKPLRRELFTNGNAHGDEDDYDEEDQFPNEKKTRTEDNT